MGHVRLVVDHQKIDYNGPFNATELFSMIENFLFERGFDKKQDKDFEQNTPSGKSIEWQISPWKRITDYVRHIIKVRILCFELEKIDATSNRRKAKMDNGRVIIVIDGFIEYDAYNQWEGKPILTFIRSIYDFFVYKIYTERFEQVLVHDVNHLYTTIEKFLNLYRHFKVVSRHSIMQT